MIKHFENPSTPMNDFLMHYGVIGMHWGIRRNPALAFKKASHKKYRLDKKSDNREIEKNRAHKAYMKALKELDKAHNRAGNLKKGTEERRKADAKESHAYVKANSAQNKYEMANFKSMKAKTKAAKWNSAMLKSFKAPSYFELERRYKHT